MDFIFWIIIILVIFKVFAKLTTGFCKSNTCLVGKVALVTGGSAGLGYETVLGLASRGCKVIIASRSSDDKIKEDIIKTTNNPNIITKSLDLSSFQSVRKFAAEINETEDRLDILINNAGVLDSGPKITEDGINRTMQVNHFGPFLLTHLLSDLLKKSAPSRIIFVSSIMALFHNINDLNELINPRNPEKLMNIYASSKLCNVIASQQFAKRFQKFGVTSNSLHPGVVATDIFATTQNIKILFTVGNKIWANIFKNPYEGAQTSIHLAVSDEVKDVTGKYYLDCIQFINPIATNNEEFCQKVWEFSKKVVKIE